MNFLKIYKYYEKCDENVSQVSLRYQYEFRENLKTFHVIELL